LQGENIPEAVEAILNIWSHLMTFFAGAHNCIGFCFSVADIHVSDGRPTALLFALIRELRTFRLELAMPANDIGSTGALQHPFILAERERDDQMPMIVKLCATA
jgi:hypothetical protein